MSTDSSIVQAARSSYGEGTKTANQDADLINYLLNHKHTTPFEMCKRFKILYRKANKKKVKQCVLVFLIRDGTNVD